MGEPMDRSRRVFMRFGPFQQAFPTLDEATVEFTEYYFMQEMRHGTWHVSWDGGLMPCGNTFCRRGGYELDRQIQEIARSGAVEKEVRLDCRGDEGSPKGRRIGRRCQRHIEARITLKYRTGPEGDRGVPGEKSCAAREIGTEETRLTPSSRVLVKPSFVRPGIGDACTLCLHEGSQIWRKTYRSEEFAWQEASELGLIDENNSRGERGDPAQHPLSRALIPETKIDIVTIASRGFRK